MARSIRRDDFNREDALLERFQPGRGESRVQPYLLTNGGKAWGSHYLF
jgi:hypothetical protein